MIGKQKRRKTNIVKKCKPPLVEPLYTVYGTYRNIYIVHHS